MALLRPQCSTPAWRWFAVAACCAASVLAALPAGAKPAHRNPPAHGNPSATQAIDAVAFNQATDTPLLRMGSKGPAVIRAQILLDRAWYSSGEIDGRFAANMRRMVTAYQLARGMKGTGTVTPETWQALRADGAPLLTRYTITAKDAAGPFVKTPRDMEERAKLPALPYESLEEALGERFHSSIALLRQLNPGRKFEEGVEITVPDVGEGKPPAKAASIEIDKAAHVLYLLDAAKRPVAGFPISIGNEKSDPLPIGRMTIRNEVKNPRFTYNPAILKNAPRDARKVDVPPGPNNPVGNIWLGLSKPHWGIHGTPDPSNVGHAETNGCIHMTNWDAERLSLLAKAGFRVEVRP
jgi:lipoprotein-anchoring transpeptidase ErfK/SrfK